MRLTAYIRHHRCEGTVEPVDKLTSPFSLMLKAVKYLKSTGQLLLYFIQTSWPAEADNRERRALKGATLQLLSNDQQSDFRAALP